MAEEPAEARPGNDDRKKSELDEELDQALEATFPASDPVSIGSAPRGDKPDRPEHRRPPAIDVDLVERLARRAAKKQEGGG